MPKSEFDWTSILIDSSKKLVEFSAELVLNQPEIFESLLDLSMKQTNNKNFKFSQRASRIVTYIIEKNPDFLNKHSDRILNFLEKIEDDSIRFNFLKIYTICSLPEDDDKLGLLTKICYDALESQTKRIAVKIYSIEILYRISQLYPDMKYELKSILEIYLLDAQPAFINRAEKIISKL